MATTKQPQGPRHISSKHYTEIIFILIFYIFTILFFSSPYAEDSPIQFKMPLFLAELWDALN